MRKTKPFKSVSAYFAVQKPRGDDQDQPKRGRGNQAGYWDELTSKEKRERFFWTHDQMLLDIQQRKQQTRRM